MEAQRRKWSILREGGKKLHTGGDTSRLVVSSWGVELRMESSVGKAF